ncbi:MAG: TadE family protein [Candidatus Acidiferrales bacterium]
MTLDGCGSKSSTVQGKRRARLPSRRNLSGERGAELVEFALVFMAVLMFLFGIMGFGHALYVYHFVSNAAREGTRYAIVNGSACLGSPNRCPDVYLKNNVPQGIDSNFLTVTPTWQDTTSHAPGTWVRVEVSYDFQFRIPLLPPSVTMSSSSQMVISQ